MPKSVVYKFDVADTTADGEFEIALPEDAKVLTFDFDGRDQLCLWAEIPDATKTKIMPKRKFRAIPTGKEFEPEGKYVVTIFRRSHISILPTLVFHIYELEA